MPEHVIKAAGYSLAGIGAAWRHEMAFRIEIIIIFLMLPGLIWLPCSLVIKGLILFSLLLVPIMELINSAIEWCIDYISLERHPLAKRAKDMGSAAVFMASVNSGCMWLIGFADAFQWLGAVSS